MKKRQKGFMLVETLVVSTLVSTVLIALYLQFNNIVKNFDRDFHYNSVDNLYAAQNIKNFILQDNNGTFYKNLKIILEQNIASNNNRFLEVLTDCSGNSGNAYRTEACQRLTTLTSFYQVKQIIFTREKVDFEQTDYQLLLNASRGEKASQNFATFIRRINADPEPIFDENYNQIYNYRIIVEFDNNEYATLIIAN